MRASKWRGRERLRVAGVAQSAEQLFCKQQVIGSSPIVGSVDGQNVNACSADKEDVAGLAL